MKFNRVYVELTGFCGLECPFCPPKNRQSLTFSLDKFDALCKKLQKITKNICLHVLGDPLTLTNLENYLNIIQKHKMRTSITTSGVFISKHTSLLATHPSIKQINFSLNSFNGIKKSLSFDDYISQIYSFCDEISIRDDRFVNLRLWNGGGEKDDLEFFETVSKSIQNRYSIELENKKRTRIKSRVIFDFDDYFEWPNKSAKEQENSFCLGLSDHFAILSSGTVVPCCLDCDGTIPLGNIFEQELDTILHSNKSKAIIEGFKKNEAVEELCQKCSYRLRFNQTTS